MNRTRGKLIPYGKFSNLPHISVYLAFIALDKYGHYAILLYRSMKGRGTRNNTLIRLILTHCEIDLVDIEYAYYATLGGTLQSKIAVSNTI